MGFCILFWLTGIFMFLSYPKLINYLGSGHYNTCRAGCTAAWLLWWLNGYILTNLCGTLNWNLTCRDLSLILICGTLSWVLNCETLCLILNCGTLSLFLYCGTLCLICRTLYHIHKLILNIWISWIRGIWSIHPNPNISECFPYLKCAFFLCIYTKLYPSSVQVKST